MGSNQRYKVSVVRERMTVTLRKNHEVEMSQEEKKLLDPSSPDSCFLKKPQAIIHRTHATTIVEEKLYSAFLLVARVAIKRGQDPSQKFTTTANFLKNFACLNKHGREQLQQAIESLQKNIWQYDLFEEDKFIEWKSFPALGETGLDKDGTVSFCLPPTLLEALQNPHVYTLIDLRIFRGLKSVYSIALYECGLTHLGGEKYFSLEDFRRYMGIKENEYKTNGDLRRYVIDLAVNENNIKSDIRVDYQLVKVGQGSKLTGVKFIFSKAPDDILTTPDENISLEFIAELLSMLPESVANAPFVPMFLQNQLEQGEEHVRSNIQYFVERLSAKGMPKVANPAGLLRTVFSKDLGKEVRTRAALKVILDGKEARPSEADLKREEQLRIEQVEAEREQLQRTALLDHYNALSEFEKAELDAEIDTNSRNNPYFAKFSYDDQIIAVLEKRGSQ